MRWLPLVVLLLPLAFALQVSILSGTLSGNTIVVKGQEGTIGSAKLSIINDKTVPVTVTVSYSGAYTTLYKDNLRVRAGTTYTYSFALVPNSQAILDIRATIIGTKEGTLTITSTDGFSRTYTLKFMEETQETTEQSCLVALTPRRYLTMLTNQTQYVTIYFKNKCNHPVDIIDLILEGVPKQIATIYKADLPDELEPYKLLKVVVLVSTKSVKAPATYTFSVKLLGTYRDESYTASTDFILDVLSSVEEYKPQPKPAQPTKVIVNYTTEGGKLVILHVEPPDAKIYIFIKKGDKEEKITYDQPIDLRPNTQYCIYAYKEGLQPFYKCFKTPVKHLCYSLEPQGKVLNKIYYYKVNTTVRVTAYDCSSLEKVKFVLFVNGKKIENNTIKITQPIKYNVVIDAGEDYEKKEFTIQGYVPITISGIPMYPDNATITLSGTFADQANIKIIYVPNGTVIYQGTGSVHEVTFNETGEYKIIVTTPLETITKTIYIRQYTILPQPQPNPLVEFLRKFWYIIVIPPIAFIAMFLYVRAKEEASLEALAEKAAEIASKGQ